MVKTLQWLFNCLNVKINILTIFYVPYLNWSRSSCSAYLLLSFLLLIILSHYPPSPSLLLFQDLGADRFFSDEVAFYSYIHMPSSGFDSKFTFSLRSPIQLSPHQFMFLYFEFFFFLYFFFNRHYYIVYYLAQYLSSHRMSRFYLFCQ